MRSFLIPAILLAASFTASAQSAKQHFHDGDWWKSKPAVYHDGFVSGFKASEHHAGRSLLDKLGAPDLVTGLDKFYEDFRNRNIVFEDALPYVADQLSGVPDDKLAARILKMRAAATANAENHE